MNDVTQQRGLRGVIARHPLVSFFVLANALSWIAWTPYILSNNGLGVWDYTFELGQLTGMLPGAYLGPITSALIVTAITGGAAGLRQWGARLWRWRVRWHWYAIAVLGVPAALILTGLIVSGGQVMAPSVTVLAVYLPMLVLQMLTTGLAEEPGWRDFALPAVGTVAHAALPDRMGRLPGSQLDSARELRRLLHRLQRRHGLGVQPHRSEPSARHAGARERQQLHVRRLERDVPGRQ